MEGICRPRVVSAVFFMTILLSCVFAAARPAAEEAEAVSCRTEKCHAAMGRKKFVHGPVRDGECVGCHTPHVPGGKAGLQAFGQDSEMCFRCHDSEKRLFAGDRAHFPVARGECLSCHDPHETDLEFHLKRGNVRELCAACHPIALQKQNFMHEPFAQGDCVACHAPHLSDFPSLLTGVGKDVCLVCHQDRKSEFQRRFVHAPVAKDCGLCHDPHGSPVPFQLRTTKDEKGQYLASESAVKDSCLLCHRKLNPETAAQIESAPVPHKPVAEGKCTVCHTPHSTNYPKQLKTSVAELCFSCHKETGEKIKGSKYLHGPLRNGDCVLCHQVHGSAFRRLLRAEFVDEFYGEFNVGKYMLCFNCHNASVVTDQASEETGFRNGQTNLHALHVIMDTRGRNCKTCHDVHASNQENHVREKIPYQGRHVISLKFTKTPAGGGCVVGCHRPRQYDRLQPVAN